MTKTLARIALPAALALAAFGAQAGEGPIDVRVAPTAAQTAQPVQPAPAAATSQMQSAAKATLLPGA